jgi:hypothetical protein
LAAFKAIKINKARDAFPGPSSVGAFFELFLPQSFIASAFASRANTRYVAILSERASAAGAMSAAVSAALYILGIKSTEICQHG